MKTGKKPRVEMRRTNTLLRYCLYAITLLSVLAFFYSFSFTNDKSQDIDGIYEGLDPKSPEMQKFIEEALSKKGKKEDDQQLQHLQRKIQELESLVNGNSDNSASASAAPQVSSSDSSVSNEEVKQLLELVKSLEEKIDKVSSSMASSQAQLINSNLQAANMIQSVLDNVQVIDTNPVNVPVATIAPVITNPLPQDTLVDTLPGDNLPAVDTLPGDLPATVISTSPPATISTSPPATVLVNQPIIQDSPVGGNGPCQLDEVYSETCKTCFKTQKPFIARLHYVHIPRTAGSAFTIPIRAFLDCGPAGRGCWGDPASTVEGNIDCGGRFIGCYGNAPLKQKHSVTIFREPVARLRSSFMVKEFPGGNEQEKAAAKSTTSLKSYVALEGISNCMTKMILGRTCTDKTPITESEIELAKTRLVHLDFIGITEHYKTSVCLFYKTFGGGVPTDADFTIVKKNPAYDPKSFLSPDDQNAAQQSEFADISLYNAALGLFQQRLAEHGMQFVD